MTVFTRYGNAVKDPASLLAAKGQDAEGTVKNAYSKITLASDGIGSVHLLGRLPSNARILPSSTFYYTALTGLTSYDIGIGVNGAAISGKDDALVSAADIHTAGSKSMVNDVAAGSLGKLLWDLAGYSVDPGGMLDIIGTVDAAASTTGTIEAFINFTK